MQKYSVVIPLYNCARTVRPLVERLVSTMEKIGLHQEIILVDDADPTDVWSEVVMLASEFPGRVFGLKLSRNFGQHPAIVAGLERSTGSYVIVMDGDLQDIPEEIEKFIPQVEKGYDAVFARRTLRQDGIPKRLASIAFYRILSFLTGTKQDPGIANFGIYSRRFVESVLSMKDQIKFFPVMIRWVGFKVTYVDVFHGSRSEGKSGYNFIKLIQLGLNTAISFSERPLTMVLVIGLIIAMTAFLFGVIIALLALRGQFSVTGWASLLISIWFLSGVIISVIGMVGLYVGRIFNQVKGRPVFIVSETTF